jgi:hypothetical protein
MSYGYFYDHRAAFVAALRRAADLIESDESLPVPQWAFLQASAAGLTCGGGEAARFAAVRTFADRLHVGVTVNPRTGARRAALPIPPGVLYSLTATPDVWPAPVDPADPALDDVLVLDPAGDTPLVVAA